MRALKKKSESMILQWKSMIMDTVNLLQYLNTLNLLKTNKEMESMIRM